MAVLVVGLLAALLLGLAEHRRRMELVARAAHELRGALTATGLALHAASRAGGQITAAQRELERAALALRDLDAARHGRTTPARRVEVDLADLLHEQVAVWSAAGPVKLDVAPGLTLPGDPVRLAQATGNLVANAIEHGSGQVSVTARCAGDRVIVAVQDGGPGLQAGALRAPWLRARCAGRRRAGRGRGLGIVARIAAAHGGRLRVGAGGAPMLELPVPR